MSYTQLLYHAVIRTHCSERTITEDHERDLYAYILGMCKNRHVVLYRIGGMPDHIHMLVGLPASLPIAKFIQEIKSVTTVWMRKNPNFPYFDHWSNEYAAFTYAMRDKEMIINYIKNQKEHHKTVSFEEEYRQFIIESGGTIDERFFLKD